ncbi:uncharacterized protein EV420DRAFT_1646360 [Desarmillaria tabescens]|uniref:Protein kinase domain-containing protein n=1 Tax=Armillaria tabescens TaxID=1929756 RepID=A0AA39JYH5_ARMTA|nr:uncharacterized protein EV420DRAFT_1646360 [Desarmillaria tabescens]KAK0451270.1 hypothetical protein EV420DRAFT_1646360 [Desarmillaria tabescens]
MSPNYASRICGETTGKEKAALPPEEEEDGKAVEGLPEDYESWRGLDHNVYAMNGLMNACYCSRGGDKLVRIMVHKNVGQNDLDIMRSLSRSRHIFAENNHILPLLDERHFGNIVFGVFPLLKGPNLSGAMHRGSLNSANNIMHLLLQAFEGIAYLHKTALPIETSF